MEKTYLIQFLKNYIERAAYYYEILPLTKK